MLKRWHWLNGWSLYWALAGVVLGGAIHIFAVLALPYLAEARAWEQLRQRTPVNAAVLLPTPTPEAQLLPMMAHDVRYAVCRFDLLDGPVTFRTQLLDSAWSISIYTPLGLNHYTVTGADIRRDDVTVVLTQAVEDDEATVVPGTGATSNVVTVTTPSDQGLLVMRAPLRSSAYTALTEAALQTTTCEISGI